MSHRLKIVHLLAAGVLASSLVPDGPALLQLLEQETAPLNGELAQKLDKIVAEAYTKLAATSLPCWRYLHTDASIASALVSPPSDAVAKLDAAIIVSGAGEGRLDLILDIIQRIQSDHWPPSSQLIPQFTEVTLSREDGLGPPIPCLATPPSLAAFQSREHNRPFILRAYARHWPALKERPWASTEYLLVPVEVGRDYRTDDWTQKLVSWDTFLASLDSTDDKPLYLAQHSLLMQFPTLRADIEVPDYLVINAWLGPAGTVSPAHTDPYFNTYVQVVGSKTVWMAPPRCEVGMYANGNTSGVDVFAAEHREHPDFESVQEFAMRATLDPGDLLYMPAGWWHAMRAETRSFSVSMWF
ncbi:Clavaminate synthase-like protein [Mycena filopes]|nr:Clavaminate synthase-like protein [Mycena filopes]